MEVNPVFGIIGTGAVLVFMLRETIIILVLIAAILSMVVVPFKVFMDQYQALFASRQEEVGISKIVAIATVFTALAAVYAFLLRIYLQLIGIYL